MAKSEEKKSEKKDKKDKKEKKEEKVQRSLSRCSAHPSLCVVLGYPRTRTHLCLRACAQVSEITKEEKKEK